jgi:excisionase family DNA binding protein
MMTISELASASGWPPSRIRSLIKARKLAYLRMDGLTLLPADALDEFLREHLVKPEASDGR